MRVAVLAGGQRRSRIVHPLPHRVEILPPGVDRLGGPIDFRTEALIEVGYLT
jgi:hypothetical protein